ncbi:MAG: asparagine synthase-related protein [Vicinamibacterales bacterium]
MRQLTERGALRSATSLTLGGPRRSRATIRGATQQPVELRYPFFDVRLLSLAVTLPSYPWCVNKEILRRVMRGRLPEPVRVRPKAPLAAGAPATHGRWTLGQAVDAIEACLQWPSTSMRRSSGRRCASRGR